MNKKYIVRLTDQERNELAAVIKKLKGTRQKVQRAQILSEVDADGPIWTDHRIAEAFGCRTKTVENIRQRLVEHSFQDILDGVKRATPPVEKLLSGEQEAGSSPRASDRLPGLCQWDAAPAGAQGLQARRDSEHLHVRQVARELARSGSS
jgi:hypothetical protein